MKQPMRRQSISALAPLALAIVLSGCFGMSMPGPDFHRAVFSRSGDQVLVRSDDRAPWRAVQITLDTDAGFFSQKTGDMEPGQTSQLPLTNFVDSGGKRFGSGKPLKSVWVHARYPDGSAVNELAFPAETFGYKPPRPMTPLDTGTL